MLVIKMLKKAANKNNIELAEYLNKTRNTIASWENDEESIPNTEKLKLSNRFEFDYNYWDVGLDKTIAFYQKMYSDIKNGYLKDNGRQSNKNESRIDEILKYCDGTSWIIDDYKLFDQTNEFNHYQYIKSLLNGIDPIDNSKLDSNHFINEYKHYFKDFDDIIFPFNEFSGLNFKNDDDILYEPYLTKLKEWRTLHALKEGVKAFQVLSDEVLKNIVSAFKNDNKELLGIKNFPYKKAKYQKYYKELISVLEEIK